jgi:peptidoglycan/xylan/chitin deacetylase (PgdA/CDA1 family)
MPKRLIFATLLLSCGGTRTAETPTSQTEVESSALCTAAWNPSWKQGSGANEWWVEYIISGGTVSSAWLQVGTKQVLLKLQYGKWTASSPFRVVTGTQVILHATNNLNQAAQTFSFAYLVSTQPTTDACAGTCAPNCGSAVCGSDGCGGSCGNCPAGSSCNAGACVQPAPPPDAGVSEPRDGGITEPRDAGVPEPRDAGVAEPPAPSSDAGTSDAGCTANWNPTWQQANADNWWIEFSIGRGTVTSAWLEIVGGAQVTLSTQWGKWSASTSKIPTGTPVVLHATDDLGHTAQTVQFGYLTTTAPVTDQCRGSGPPIPQCTPMSGGMVSLTLDDAWSSQYTLARDQLLSHAMKATLFLITDPIDQHWSGYLNLTQARAFISDGDEIASHTLTHPHLPTLSDAGIDDELRLSKQWLQDNLGVTATDFASPFGEYNDTVIADAKRYYQTHSTVNHGLNFPSTDLYHLRRETVFDSTTPAQIRSWVQNAQSSNGWLILLFHNFVTDTPPDAYHYRIADFQTVLDDLAAAGIDVVTVEQGVKRLRCQ